MSGRKRAYTITVPTMPKSKKVKPQIEWVPCWPDGYATRNARLRAALVEIRNTAFYHMTRHADERGDRKILGEIKERAIAALKP